MLKFKKEVKHTVQEDLEDLSPRRFLQEMSKFGNPSVIAKKSEKRSFGYLKDIKNALSKVYKALYKMEDWPGKEHELYSDGNDLQYDMYSCNDYLMKALGRAENAFRIAEHLANMNK